MATNTSNLRTQLAEVLGIAPDDIKMIEPQWTRYMKRGVILSLHVGRWRARAALTYADLGLPEPDEDSEKKALQDLLALGRKNLLPKRFIDRFDAIEQSGRKAVDRGSHKTYWGSFVTPGTFNETIEDLRRFQAEYMQTANEMCDNWDEVLAELADDYRAAARRAYRNLRQLSPDLASMSETSFVEGFVKRVLVMVPPRQTVRESFRFEWDIYYIPLPSLLEQDMAEAERVKQEALQLRHEADLARQRDYQQLQAEREMARAVAEHAQAQKTELIDQFMKDVVVQMRQLIYGATVDVLESMRRNEHLHPRSITQLRNLVSQIQGLNFFGDRDVDQMVNRIRLQLDQAPEARNPGTVRAVMTDIGIVTRQALMSLGETPRSGRNEGIADVPAMQEVRTARQRLELPVPEMTERRQVRQPAEMVQ